MDARDRKYPMAHAGDLAARRKHSVFCTLCQREGLLERADSQNGEAKTCVMLRSCSGSSAGSTEQATSTEAKLTGRHHDVGLVVWLLILWSWYRCDGWGAQFTIHYKVLPEDAKLSMLTVRHFGQKSEELRRETGCEIW